jgi:hypothetical protein
VKEETVPLVEGVDLSSGRNLDVWVSQDELSNSLAYIFPMSEEAKKG